MLNTRLKRWAQVIEARRSVGVWSCASSGLLGTRPLPRLAGVTRARCLLLGANTPSTLTVECLAPHCYCESSSSLRIGASAFGAMAGSFGGGAGSGAGRLSPEAKFSVQ